jgi:hypothetical protein
MTVFFNDENVQLLLFFKNSKNFLHNSLLKLGNKEKDIRKTYKTVKITFDESNNIKPALNISFKNRDSV